MPEFDTLHPSSADCPYCHVKAIGCPCGKNHCDCNPKKISLLIKPDCVICGLPQGTWIKTRREVAGKVRVVEETLIPERMDERLERFCTRGNWCEKCNFNAYHGIEVERVIIKPK